MLKDQMTSVILRRVWDQADFSKDLGKGCNLEHDYEVY